MRYQDRLLSLLPAEHPHVARYVCRELEGLALHFDSERIVGALDTAVNGADPAVALQAAASLHRFLPSHLESHYAPETWPAGPRLSRGIDLTSLSVRAALKDADSGNDALSRSAIHLLDPAVVTLVDMIPRVQLQGRQRAFRALAHLPHGAASDAVRRIVAKEGAEAGPLALHAMAVHCRAGKEEALLKLIGHLDGTWLYSAAIGSLAMAPFDAVHQFLVARAQRATVEVLPSFAAAFESFGTFGVLKPLATLAGRGTGWTALQVLQTLARLKDEKALDVLETIYWRHDHPSIREAAVRAAGSIKGEASAGFLRTVLSGELHPTVAARALQSLQSVGSDPGSLARLAAPFLASLDPETAVSALLATFVADEPAAVGALRRLVRSRDPFLRAQGAYCMAYYQGRPSLQLLSFLAQKDPVASVRRQAIASLAYYETTPLVRELLLELLPKADEQTLPDLAAVLGRADIAEDAGAAEALIAAAERFTDTPIARAVFRALGRVGHRTAAIYLTDKLRGKQDPEDVVSILEALDLRHVPALSAVREAAGQKDARVRATVAVLLWNQGDAEGIRILRELLADTTDRRSFVAAVEAIERAAVAGTRLVQYSRFRALAAWIRANVETAGYQAFSSSELSLSIPREGRRGLFDPNRTLVERGGWRDQDAAGLAADGDPMAVSGTHRPVTAVRVPYAPTFTTTDLDAVRADPRLVRTLLWIGGAIALAVIVIAVIGLLRIGSMALVGPASRLSPPPAAERP